MNDDDLRVLFRELEDDDRTSEPSFRAQWEAAESNAATLVSRQRRTRVWIATAAAAVVVIGVGLVTGRSNRAQPAELPTITNWQSPTAGLLRASERALAAPSILSSTLGAIPTPVNHSGARR